MLRRAVVCLRAGALDVDGELILLAAPDASCLVPKTDGSSTALFDLTTASRLRALLQGIGTNVLHRPL